MSYQSLPSAESYPFIHPGAMPVALGYETASVVEDPGDPWQAIWLRPRKVARWALAQPASKKIYGLLAGGALASAAGAKLEKAGTVGEFGLFLALTLVIAVPILFVVNSFVMPLFLSMAGRLLGGSGDVGRVRTAMAYAQIPVIWSAVLSGLKLVIVLAVLSLGQPGTDIYRAPWLLLTLSLALGGVALGFWSYIIMLACLAEAHRFSMWKAFGTTVLLGFVAGVLLFGVLVAVMMTSMRLQGGAL